MNKLRRQAGITLIELIIAIVVMAILAASALPSFQGSIDRSRVSGAANGLFADMQYAKAEAIKQGRAVSVRTTAGSPWSYCVTSSDCATAADVLKTVSGADFANTSLDLSSTVTFEPRRASATTGAVTLTFTGKTSTTKAVSVSAVGRVVVQ